MSNNTNRPKLITIKTKPKPGSSRHSRGWVALQFLVVFGLVFSLLTFVTFGPNVKEVKAYAWGSPQLVGPTSNPHQSTFQLELAVRPTDGKTYLIGASGSGNTGAGGNIPAQTTLITRLDQPNSYLCSNNCTDAAAPGTQRKYPRLAFSKAGVGFITSRHIPNGNDYRAYARLMNPDGSLQPGFDLGATFKNTSGASDYIDFVDVTYSAPIATGGANNGMVLYMVGQIGYGANRPIVFASSQDNGQSWGELQTLSDSGPPDNTQPHAFPPINRVCVDPRTNDVHVVMFATGNMVARSRIGGVWQANPTVLAASANYGGWVFRNNLAIACGADGRVYTVWESAPGQSLGMGRYTPGIGWELVHANLLPGQDAYQVGLSTSPDGRVWLAYSYLTGDPPSGAGTVVTVSGDTGQTFASAVTAIPHGSSHTEDVGLVYNPYQDQVVTVATFSDGSRDTFVATASAVGGLPPTPTPAPTATPTATSAPTQTLRPTATPTLTPITTANPTVTAATTTPAITATPALSPSASPASPTQALTPTSSTPTLTPTQAPVTVTPVLSVTPIPTPTATPTITNTPLSLLPTPYPSATPDTSTIEAARQRLTADAAQIYAGLTATAQARAAAITPTSVPTATSIAKPSATPPLPATATAITSRLPLTTTPPSTSGSNTPLAGVAVTPAPTLLSSTPIPGATPNDAAISFSNSGANPATSATDQSNSSAEAALIFALPTATATATATIVPTVSPLPTSTNPPPTDTPLPPISTPLPPIIGGGAGGNNAKQLVLAGQGENEAVQALTSSTSSNIDTAPTNSLVQNVVQTASNAEIDGQGILKSVPSLVGRAIVSALVAAILILVFGLLRAHSRIGQTKPNQTGKGRIA